MKTAGGGKLLLNKDMYGFIYLYIFYFTLKQYICLFSSCFAINARQGISYLDVLVRRTKVKPIDEN